MARTLTERELRLALLERQLLLRRSAVPLTTAIERVGLLQTQYAPSAYICAWSRLEGFERDQLTRALERRRVIQATMLRTTIHMSSRRDYWPVIEAVRSARRDWWLRATRHQVGEAQIRRAAGRVRRFLADDPKRRKEIVAALGIDSATWNGASLWVDLVRVPPSGTWEQRRADLYGLAEEWVGPNTADEDQGIDLLVRRYLGAFGPASRCDIASWAGLPASAIDAALARTRVRRFVDEAGGTLVDLPRAQLPDEDTPVPVRFLPTWDATLLVHARRTQILPEPLRPSIFNTKTPHSHPTFLVDGQVAGTWASRTARSRWLPSGPCPDRNDGRSTTRPSGSRHSCRRRPGRSRRFSAPFRAPMSQPRYPASFPPEHDLPSMPADPTTPRRCRFARVAAFVATCMLTALPAIAAGAAPVRDGFTGASGEATRLAGSTTSATGARAGTVIRGIDVSHWQGEIDWNRVAETGKEFAYLKSTDDIDYFDETFAFNRAQAKANGISVGAYHFARPDRSKGDAVREAKWFVARTDPRPGELVPVLDIETNKGLTQTQMTTWAHRWIAKVRELTGVTAMVYTSPYGWLERFGGSKRLAREGSPLWVAHWGVSSPLVPAGNWDGKGWIMWQYTSHGHVAGIQGRVDLDRLFSGTLARLTIRRLSLDVVGGAGVVTSAPGGLGCAATCEKTVTPDATVTLTAVPDDDAYFTGWGGACHGTTPTCTITMNGNRSVTTEFVTDITAPEAALKGAPSLTGPLTVVFDEPVRRVRASNVILTQPGGGGVTVSRTCRSRAGRPVPCATGTVRSVDLHPARPLVPGRAYEAVVNPGGAPPVTDLIGNPADQTNLPFTGRTVVGSAQVPVDHSWRRVTHQRALGDSFVVERQRDATLSFGFSGRSLTWHTVMGPAYGRAEVLIDGRSERIVDLWQANVRLGIERRFTGLDRGRHVVTIRPTGHARPRATDRLVAVDGFSAGGSIVRTPVTEQRWRTIRAPGAFRGRYSVADLAGAAITMRFDGVGVDLASVTGPDRGRATVLIDGNLVATIDLYSASTSFGVVHHIGGLADGPHTLRVEATGTSRAAATGTMVAFDRFDVLPGP